MWCLFRLCHLALSCSNLFFKWNDSCNRRKARRVFLCILCICFSLFFISISFRNSIFPCHPLASIILYLNILCKWPWNHSKFTPGCAFTADSGIRTLSTVVCHDMFSHNKKEACWNQTLKTLNLSVDTSARKITGTVRQRQVHRFCWRTCCSTSHRKPGVNPEFGCRRQIT